MRPGAQRNFLQEERYDEGQYDDRYADQLGPAEPLHRHIEGIHVHMEDDVHSGGGASRRGLVSRSAHGASSGMTLQSVSSAAVTVSKRLSIGHARR